MALHTNDPRDIEKFARERLTWPLGLLSVTVATLPGPSPAGCTIFVSDESGGAVPAFSDGTHWRRVTDRAIIS